MSIIKQVILKEISGHKLVILLVVLALLFLVVVILFGSAISFIHTKINMPLTAECEDVRFLVKKGDGAEQIAKNLEREGLVNNDFYFLYYIGVMRTSKNLQAGEYLLSGCMSIREIADKIISGKTSNEVTVTIPEGFGLDEIEKKCQVSGIGCQVSGIKAEGYKTEYSFLEDAPANATLEGYLFPDTYFFDRNSNAEDILRKMLDNFDNKLTENFRSDIKNQGKSIYEIVTMASLVEKEIRSREDRRIVSGILWKRLEIGIPFQVDATIMYIKAKSEKSPEANLANGGQEAKNEEITYEDLKIDSPYNTYKYKGLPPGPIANPGLDSIEAAIYPKGTEYFYYLSKPDGETVFSKTLEEHNIAKARYLR